MKSADSTVVIGKIALTGRVELVKSGSGTAVAGEYRLTTKKTLSGTAIGNSAVWVEGGSAGGITVDVASPTVFAASDGAGLFTISDQSLVDRLTVLDGYPMVRDDLVVGLGCSSAIGLPTSPEPIPEREVGVVGASAITAQTVPGSAPVRVALTTVEGYFSRS